MAFADDHNMTMCHCVLLEGGLISPASNVHLRPIQRMIQLGALRFIAGFMRRHVIKWTLQPFLRLHKYGDTESFVSSISLLPRVIWLELDYDLLLEQRKLVAKRIIGHAIWPSIALFRMPHVCWTFDLAEARSTRNPCPGPPICSGGPLHCPFECSKVPVEIVDCGRKHMKAHGFFTCTWPWRYPHLSDTEHRRMLAMKAKANIAAILAAHSPLRRCTLARRRRDPDWRFVSGVSPSSRALTHFLVCSSAQCRGESLMTASDGNSVDGVNHGTYVDDDEVSDQGDHGDYAAQDDDGRIDEHDVVRYDDNTSYPDCDGAPHGYEEYYSYRPY